MLNRSKLSRYTGLARFKRMPQVRKEPRRLALWMGDRPDLASQPEYLARVRELPCCAIGRPRHTCMGPRIAHHAGVHAAGKKCSDFETISLCSLAHTCLHEFKGPFFNWSRASMRQWEDACITETQRVLGHTPTV